MGASQDTSVYPHPAMRRLWIYAFDPHASVELETAVINDAVIQLPWESRWEGRLEPGPTNDYLEVIDHDPASGVFYEPVNLDDPVLLAQDGLRPSEGRPQFHQQMVFAVAMRTIRAFERALGRLVFWAGDTQANNQFDRNYTRRLRVYPHALREANAYYSPEKRALLFGYFRPSAVDDELDASWVFTCLSQDIVAHETTHAILHGVQRRSIEPSNMDALAFHEAFADIVALLQHFSMSDVLKHQLAASGGSLRARGLLSGLAEQFGRATGHKGALRSALDLLRHDAEVRDRSPAMSTPDRGHAGHQGGNDDETVPGKDKPSLRTATEPHERGGYLVAAVFDAFVTIYEARTSDLFRIAGLTPGTRGAGGRLSSDLVARLASEAAKAADHVLRLCVRALDYIPPVDLRFGEYLRAIVTADTDLVPDDTMRYRVAFVEAFKKRGIRVPGCISMAPDSLLWDPPQTDDFQLFGRMLMKKRQLGKVDDAISALFMELLQNLQLSISFGDPNVQWSEDPVSDDDQVERRTLSSQIAWDQARLHREMEEEEQRDENGRNLRELSMWIALYNQKRIHNWFNIDTEADEDWEKLLGLRLLPLKHRFRGKREDTLNLRPLGSVTCKEAEDTRAADLRMPSFEVSSARIARRAGPNGEELHQLIVQIVQRRRAYFDSAEQASAEQGDIKGLGEDRWEHPDFWFRGGATIHVDLRDGQLVRVIRKRIDDDHRLEDERRFRTGESGGFALTAQMRDEPFAFMHRMLA